MLSNTHDLTRHEPDTRTRIATPTCWVFNSPNQQEIYNKLCGQTITKNNRKKNDKTKLKKFKTRMEIDDGFTSRMKMALQTEDNNLHTHLAQ